MKIIVISSDQHIDKEVEIINELFNEGMEYFHLRKPEYDSKKTKQLLDGINPVHLNKVALHQYHNLAKDYGINRLHYTEKRREGMEESEVLNLKNEGNILSTSVHSMISFNALSRSFTYSFISPVFDSISKVGYYGKLAEDLLFKKQNIPTQLIALGGINKLTIRELSNLNIDGVGILGALWMRPEAAVTQFRLLKTDIEKIYNTTNRCK